MIKDVNRTIHELERQLLLIYLNAFFRSQMKRKGPLGNM